MKGNEFDTIEGMTTYIGTKISGAKPMNRQEYNDFRGWTLPADEDGSDPGYIVQYSDGYVSWSPAAQFEQAYRPASGMPFGLAIEAMMQGHKVARTGWNGKGIYLELAKAENWFINTSDGLRKQKQDRNDFILINTIGLESENPDAPRNVVPWLASQTDMLSDDWQIIQ